MSILTFMFWISGILQNARYLFSDNFYFRKYSKKMYNVLDGTLYSSISLVENGREIMPTPQQWEGSYSYK
jgi:hypothetical protein